ncbi:MAG: hypothetical protein ACEQSR_06865 [Candidatus Methylacidiphilales bacterium]
MEIVIKTSKWYLFSRLTFVVMVLAMPILFALYANFYMPISYVFFVVVLLFCFWIILFFTITFLLLPLAVFINEENNTITLHYFKRRFTTLKLENIISYSSVQIYSRRSTKYGILLHLDSGKNLLVSNFNFKSYTPMLFYLNREQVKKEDKLIVFSWIKYFKNCLH